MAAPFGASLPRLALGKEAAWLRSCQHGSTVSQAGRRATPRPVASIPLHSYHSASRSTPSPKRLRTSPSTTPSLLEHRSLPSASAFSQSHRTLSITSLATRFRLPVLRKHATDAPEDVEKQLKLFRELMESGEVKDMEELIGRWEELTEFWAAEGAEAAVRPLIKDDDAFKLYLRALASLASTSADPPAFFAKLSTAPSKRAALLDPITASTPAPTVLPTTPASPTTPIAPTPGQVLSPAALVTALFSGASGRGKGGEAKVVSQGSFGGLSSLGMGSTVAASASGVEPIRVIVEEAKSPLLLRAARFLFITLLYSFLLLSLLSLLLDSSGILRGANAQTTPFTATAAPDATDAAGRGTTFKDVHGVEEAKAELYEVVEFLKDPTRFEKLGGRLPRGVLLTGPPGTGKTLLARAVAGEAGVAFFAASGSEFDEMYVGVGARRIRELFAAARKAAPAIIFIDELDAIGGKRSPRDAHYTKQTLNQLLVELDGFNPGEGVILIGATNFPESLDKALVRPGRFDRHIVVPLPDVRGRMSILQHHMRNVGYDKKLVDISMIARGTIGFSGADLQALVNQAAVKASAENAPAVRASHFEWAKERIMMGAARKSAFITEKDKLATAYHEGGHALVALYTPGAYPLQSVTVVPRGMALGYTLMLPEMDKNSHSLSEYRAKLDVAMGGRVAEELIYGKDNVTDGASSDISNATSMASNMVRRFGFSDVIGPVAHTDGDAPISPQTQAAIETEIRGLIEAAQQRAKDLLLLKAVELERLARALVEHETLDLNEVKRVVKGEKIVKNMLDVL